MRTKVFGIGWAKTGTTSLGDAFEILGYKRMQMRLDLVIALIENRRDEVFAVTDAYDAFEDWPWSLLYEEMAERYPDAKFILTLRAPEAIANSYHKMVGRTIKKPPRMDEIRRYLYGFDPEYDPPERIVERVQAHNAAVRAYFANQPDRLLEVDWARGDGWQELCNFLDHDIPNTTFPHANPAVRDSGLEDLARRSFVGMRRHILGARRSRR